VGKLGLAFRVFFKTLGNSEFSRNVAGLLDGSAGLALSSPPAGVATPEPARPVVAPTPARSDALTLLAALQREARLVDFLQESLADYSDEQVGGAVREVHRGCAAALARMFDISPIAAEQEGESAVAPVGFDAARYRLTGNVQGSAPYRGAIRHRGWEARRCDLPAWSGSASGANVLSQIEIEV
jgi:hypothetical protein